MKRILLAVMMIAACVAGASAQGARYCRRGDVSFILGIGDKYERINQILLSTTHGVSFLSDRLFAGGGIGLGLTVGNGNSGNFSLPIYADFRYTHTPVKLRPFVDVKMGISGFFSGDDNHFGEGYKPGFYTCPAVGITVPLKSFYALNFSLGYTYHRVSEKVLGANPDISYHRSFNGGGLTFSAGIFF